MEKLTTEGIPKDFADKREYFNRGIIGEKYPFVPRKIKITIR